LAREIYNSSNNVSKGVIGKVKMSPMPDMGGSSPNKSEKSDVGENNKQYFKKPPNFIISSPFPEE